MPAIAQRTSPDASGTLVPGLPGSRAEKLRTLQAAALIALYFFLVAFPLILLLVGDIPKGAGFWWDFAMAIGFSGLAMLGLQFVLIARFRRLTGPFGIDIIYFFHRWAAIGAIALLCAHYFILRFGFPDALGPASPLAAERHMTAGRLSLLLFLALIVSSVWRQQFRLEYDRWRFWHGIIAVAAVLLAIGHIQGVGYYTRTPAKEFFWTAYTVLWICVLAYIRLLKPVLLLRKPYRITSIVPERANSWTVAVAPEGRHQLRFAPGQFAWLTLGSSPFRAKEHPFSFSSSAELSPTLQFTIKELGDFTRTIKNFKPGTLAYVDGPHGVFTPDYSPGAPGLGLIAGGVGIAPIISMLRTLADRHDPRPLILIYGNSAWDNIIFREELETLKSRLNLRLIHVLSNPPAGWAGESGLITPEILRKHLLDPELAFTFFICGPTPMIRSAQRFLTSSGVPLRRIHFEHFEMV